MINNFDQIKSLLRFDNPEEFYFLQILQRKKDMTENHPMRYLGSNNNNRLIKAYYIYSLEQLDRYTPEIITLCNIFNARASINLNRRNEKIVALEMMELLARDMRVGNYNCISKIYTTVCGQVKGNDKLWLVDVDVPDMKEVSKICFFIDNLEPVGQKIKAIIPSKSGYHIISTAFNSLKFGLNYPGVEVHKNNPTNLYIP